MTTPAELGYAEPAGTDMLTKGDDAITQNARASARAFDTLDAKRYPRGGLVLAADLDTLRTAGYYTAGTAALVASLVPALPAAARVAGALEVLPITGSHCVQRWSTSGALPNQTWQRESGSNGAWTPWRRLEWAGAPLLNGAKLDDLTDPGAYPVATYAIANSLTPPLPAGSIGAGCVEVLPLRGEYAIQRWNPAGASTVLNPVWQRERNAAGWTPWHRSDGGAPVSSRTSIAALGDSLTFGSFTREEAWPARLGARLPGVTVTNYGRSGDTSNEILLRTGAHEIRLTVTGATIPASGAVAVTTAQVFGLRDGRAFSGYLAGVYGSLSHLGAERWQFTRAAAGTAVPAAGAQLFTPGPAVPSADDLLIAWMGRNDIGRSGVTEASIADHVIANHRTLLDWAAPRSKHVVFAGVTTATTEAPGSPNFILIAEINARLQALFPERFADVQRYLSTRALSDLGLTPTPADTAATAAGMIPPQLYIPGDAVHFTSAAQSAIAEHLFAPYLLRKGWI